MNSGPEAEPCVEADVVAQLLLVSVDTVRRYTLTQGLPFIALPAGRKRYLLSQVVAWRDARTTRQFQAAPALPSPAVVIGRDGRKKAIPPQADRDAATRAEMRAIVRSVCRPTKPRS
jgi:hypothetical protein